MTTEDTTAEVDELREQLRAEQETSLMLEESIADLEMAMDDAGWTAMSYWGKQEFTREGLRRITESARLMAIANPLIRRGLQLRIAYIWGQGVTVSGRAADDADGGQDVNAVVQAFLDDDSNKRSLTSSQAHEELERALGTDGNVLLACFTNPRTGRVQVRSTPFDEIQDVIKNPEDRDDVWFYLRQWTVTVVEAGYSGDTRSRQETRRAYHPALTYRPTPRPRSIDQIPVRWDAPMLHVGVNRLDGWTWGVGDVYAALPWARAYKGFLEDWAKLVKALSRYAWRATADKSSKASAAAAKIRAARQQTAPTPTREASGQSAAGATFAAGPGVTLEAIPKTGATIDSESGKPLAAMVAAALGVPVTMLLGDPGITGARATAETLDRPTELEMGMRRELWADALRQLLGYVIAQAVKAPAGALQGTVSRDDDGREVIVLAGDSETTVDIVFPDLSEMSMDKLIEAVAKADETGKVAPLVIARLLLQALGVDDVDEILDSMTDDEGRFVPPDVTAAKAAMDRFRDGEPPVEGDPDPEGPAA